MNIHGTFFERWCQEIMDQTPGWRVLRANFPVVFPPLSNPHPNQQSALDIAAESDKSLSRSTTTLLIECKKNNPEFIDWIFFPKRRHTNGLYFVHQITAVSDPNRESGWHVGHGIADLSNRLSITDEARETRGSYSDYKNNQQRTRTSNHNISDAARQITLATQALILDEIGTNQRKSDSSVEYRLSYDTKMFVPAIVTTARVFTCDFDPIDVNPKTGEIAYDRVSLTEQPMVIYEYPIPRDLQFDPFDSDPYRLPTGVNEWSFERFIRMPIVVINSAEFAARLPTLTVYLGIG
jgi:hypothetical protein